MPDQVRQDDSFGQLMKLLHAEFKFSIQSRNHDPVLIPLDTGSKVRMTITITTSLFP